ncbi:MAG: PBP1A family penicillin-binding protein [Blastocatellia bacterium]|nr:PBP1A family penicillin-binding protein [Blastocatellia bacterium]
MARAEYRNYTWRQAPFRRAYYHATSRYILAPAIILVLIAIGVLFYYYSRYSAVIDDGLKGGTFVRSSGIYAAPLTLREGVGISKARLLSHLQNVGYVSNATLEQQGNEKKGRYVDRGAVLEIYPGPDATIDGAKAFDSLRVTFNRNGDTVQSIADLENGQRLDRSQLEPELISSVVNEEREKRKIIDFKDLPQSLVDAITAVEDRAFFDHSGINWRGVLRALFRDYQAGELKEGGSSITQQLVKDFFLTPERSWTRKLSEAYMSIILEQRLTKQEIMAMYCNQIYLGQRGGFSLNGFGEAARAYFGKDISHLELHESALLAGIIRSPNYYSPYSHEDRARDRRNKVLDIMVEADRITRDQAEVARRRPLGITSGRGGLDSSDAPYFIDYLTRQLERQEIDLGMLRTMRIYSTIDLDLQTAAYEAVRKNMAEVDRMLAKRRGGTAGLQAALVAMNPKTGEILAMVGGRDYARSQLNRATEAKRQPGSIFKPFVYAAALASGADENNVPITPATTFMDEPRTFETLDGRGYSPGNFGDKYEMRALTLRDALVNSKNVISVALAERIGFSPVQQLCERAGLTRVPAVQSMALGVGEATPLQMASAYTAFANGGRRVLPISIKRVTNKEGSSRLTQSTETREVMSPQVAFVMTSMMQDVLDRGTGTRVRQMGFSATAAGKTGTSRDGWFAGYTPNLVCVVWVGFDDNADLGLTGGATAAPIWTDFMKSALRVRPELGGDFQDPGGIVSYEIDPTTGEIASGAPNTRRELFIEGTGPGDGTPLPLPDRQSEPLPDGEPKDPERPAAADPAESKETRPRTSNEPRIAGIDTDLIPLPPGAQVGGGGARTAEAAPAPKSRSFFGRLKDFFTPDTEASAEATPPTRVASNEGATERPRATPRPRPTAPPAAYSGFGGAIAQATPRLAAPAPTFTREREPERERDAKTAKPAPQTRPKPTPTPRLPVATRPRRVIEEDPKTARPDGSKGKFGKNQPPVPANTRTSSAKPVEKKTDDRRGLTAAPASRGLKKPAPTPTPRVIARATPTPRPVPRATPPPVRPTPTPAPAPVIQQAPPPPVSTPKGDGTFTVEICSDTGLLAVKGICTNTYRKRFNAANVPTKRCSAALHDKH